MCQDGRCRLEVPFGIEVEATVRERSHNVVKKLLCGLGCEDRDSIDDVCHSSITEHVQGLAFTPTSKLCRIIRTGGAKQNLGDCMSLRYGCRGDGRGRFYLHSQPGRTQYRQPCFPAQPPTRPGRSTSPGWHSGQSGVDNGELDKCAHRLKFCEWSILPLNTSTPSIRGILAM